MRRSIIQGRRRGSQGRDQPHAHAGRGVHHADLLHRHGLLHQGGGHRRESARPTRRAWIDGSERQEKANILVAISAANEIWIRHSRRRVDPPFSEGGAGQHRTPACGEGSVIIQADKRAYTETLVGVMDSARQAGASTYRLRPAMEATRFSQHSDELALAARGEPGRRSVSNYPDEPPGKAAGQAGGVYGNAGFRNAVTVDTGTGPNLGTFVLDGDLVPLVHPNPVYPQSALRRGLEGYCDLER